MVKSLVVYLNIGNIDYNYGKKFDNFRILEICYVFNGFILILC